MAVPACTRVRTHLFLRITAAMILLGALSLLASCSGGSDPLEPPAASTVQAVTHGVDAVRLAAGPGSADRGTTVDASVGAVGSGTAAADGSFSFDAVLSVGATHVTVSYTKDGFPMTTVSATTTLASRVVKPLFSTGAAPNDMVYGNESLYIANSMDNTVVRYGLDGSVLATASFDPGASPSYLGLDPGTLWVACNGSNEVVGLDDFDLTERAGQRYQLTEEGTAFIGPSQPVVIDGKVFVPRNEITSYSPTTYGPGAVSVLGAGAGETAPLPTTGINPQFPAVKYQGSVALLYLTCGGDIQFNEQWQPYAASDSYFELMWDASGISAPRALNLGPVGAGRIALAPAGYTALIGSSLAANLYAVDLETFTVVRGQDNPIVLTEAYSFTSDVAYMPGGKYALALSFNTDEMYVLDTETCALNPGPYPAPIDLTLGADMLAGATNVEIAPEPGHAGEFAAYVLYGVGNAVAKVDLF